MRDHVVVLELELSNAKVYREKLEADTQAGMDQAHSLFPYRYLGT